MRNVPRGRTRYPGLIDDYSLNYLSTIPDCLSHLDASKITGKTDNDPVATWDDLTGNLNSAVQNTEASQPLFKVNAINGKSALLFDGSNDWMDSSFSPIVTATDFTIFFVFKYVAISGLHVPIRDNTSGNGTGIVGYSTNSVDFYRINNTGLSLSTNISTEFGTQTRSIVLTKLDTTGKAYRDGVLRHNQTVSATKTIYSKIVFARNGDTNGAYSNMYACEYLLFNRGLTTDEIALINNNLNSKWGIG